MNNIIEIKNLSKKYNSLDGEIWAIKNINFKVSPGEIISLVGPSGCGKSTLLSIVAGLEDDYKGKINKKSNLRIAYMLQLDTLLPWLTIYENAILGLKINKTLTPENINYVNKLLKLYNLYEFKDNYPRSLSGGMRQRVALIRTLALKPELLLLDEPFSALDGQTRLLISDDVYKIVKAEKITVILVTHNIEDAIIFSNRVIILSDRPATIKNIININIPTNSLYEKRKDINFNTYFDTIWKDLDINE